ncbi:unnamed protein product [Adineta ricciae]|uniref:G-protein coupled receptors family 1 profile domain-containing protein n=1 Tax=Adineta ricciae TaxID=249248 RepID=A0A813TRP3_ADIRI|nr:unnamed protein product [Adineta ricciae]
MNNSLTESHVNLTRWVSSIVAPLILLGCGIGNVVSFLVLIRPRLRKQTTSIYLAVLCVAEMGTCYTGLLRQFLIDAFNLDLRTINSFTCRTHIYFTYVFLRLAPLLLALVTLQRYLYVSQIALCSLKSTCIQLSACILFACLAELHLLIYYELTDSDTRPLTDQAPLECTVNKFLHKKYYHFRSQIYPKLSLVAYTIIPLAIILLGNALLVRTVRQASRRSRSTTHKKRSVTRMLYAVSILYTVLTSPASIFLAVAPPLYELQPGFRVQWTSLRLLFYLCHSVNFILFCASGTFFRQELRAFLNSLCCYRIFCPDAMIDYDDRSLESSIRQANSSTRSSTRRYKKHNEPKQTEKSHVAL